MAKTSEREALYRATSYCVFLPGACCELRIDQPSAPLQAWLKEAGASTFAIITAYNPGSEQAGASRNAERQSQLECDLLEGNYEPYAGENVADEGGWPVEETCFVPDILLEDACALGEDYGQCAIVWGGADGVPRLYWIDSEEQ